MLHAHFFLQESYAMLNRYELLVAKEESERVDTLRYSWQKLQSLAVNTLMTFCYISLACSRLSVVGGW